MKEMIQKIIDMDKKAREITEAAEKEKLEIEKDIAQKAVQLREEVLTRARHRIEKNKQLENTILEEEWEKLKARYDAQMERMNDLYAKHGEEWVNTIVKRVLEG